MDTEMTTSALAKLFDTTPKTIADLGKREIIVPGSKRGRWQLEPSVRGYIGHLRAEAAGRDTSEQQNRSFDLAQCRLEAER